MDLDTKENKRKRQKKIKNIGPVSQNWLDDINVFSVDDVKSQGIKRIFERLRIKGYNPSLNLAYALQGAILDCHWLDLSESIRKELKSKLA